MLFEIFPAIALLDQDAERKLHHPTFAPQSFTKHISKRQLASSTIVRYTVHDWAIYSKKDIKLLTQPSVKSPDELLGLSRLGATVKCLQAESTKTCIKQQNVMT